MNKTTGLLLLAESISFDPKVKKHSIEKICNTIESDIFPFVYEFRLYIKLWFYNQEKSAMLSTCLFDDEQEKVRFFHEEEVSNKRDSNMTPGIDFNFSFKAPIPKPGNYNIRLFEKDELICDYPIFVSNKC
ncbi:hypothetical protein C0Q44_15305 [Paenibacillus sp. PCH8]|uniref:DUF6941 family protein n=1 Tax=Paenibacillus sp. PCH8 TaxID=2066524 RepID=UPI000CF97D62|nr:hypothetical protein [Paenibacillus sp. PCH8]PQP82759.1 hypothetical protein C0Q44_15305 [Paenibacillus sp. PCH8]